MNKFNGNNHHQSKAGDDDSTSIYYLSEKFDIKKAITEIEVEHNSVTLRDKEGSLTRTHIIDKEVFPIASVECEALRLLEKLRINTKVKPKVMLKKHCNMDVIDSSGYGWFVYNLPDLIACYVPHFIYPEMLCVLLNEMEKLGAIEDGTFGPEFYKFTTWGSGLPVALNMERLLENVQKVLKSNDFKGRLELQKAQSRRIRRSFRNMYRRTLEKCSRLLLVRVDLEYALNGHIKGSHPLHSDQNPNQFSIDVFLRDRGRFMNNIRGKIGRGQLAEHLLSWGWKAEYGEKRGWHLHCVFLFDASKVKSHWHYAMQLGELWVRLTGGRGAYHNCHKDLGRYGQCCLGEIRRGDEEAAAGFENFVRYLAMDDQMPIIRVSKKARVFGISRIGMNRKRANIRLRGVADANA